MSSAISQEILDHILDELRFDMASLAASSLVARRWVHTPRRHIFSVARISASNVAAFAALLEDQRCTFRRHITALEIRLVRGSQRWFVELSTRLEALGIAARCISLSLTGPQIREEAQANLFKYYNLETLRVGAVKFDSVQALSGVLGHLPRLRVLDLQASFTNTLTPLASPPLAASIQELLLSSASIHGLLPFFIDQGVMQHVIRLSFAHVRAEDFPPIRRFVAMQNTTLDALYIEVYLPYLGVSDDIFVDAMNLSALRALSRLRMRTSPSLSPDQARTLLSAITSPRMISVEISVLLQSEDRCARLDAFLAGSTAPVFEEVVIIGDVVGQDIGSVAQFLPLAAAKGILEEPED